jgi:hypothetical protein
VKRRIGAFFPRFSVSPHLRVSNRQDTAPIGTAMMERFNHPLQYPLTVWDRLQTHKPTNSAHGRKTSVMRESLFVMRKA